jgi:hypothetical protein
VIKTGDALFGSSIIEIVFGSSGLDPSGTGDLAFRYVLDNGRSGIAVAELRPSSLTGDYDGNGIVGPEDLNLWQSTFGSTTNLAADGNGNGVVDAADYVVWRSRLGHASSSSYATVVVNSVTAVPEPTGRTLIAWLVVNSGIFGTRILRTPLNLS